MAQHGWRPLHIAAIKGEADIVEILVENGADVDALDNVCAAGRLQQHERERERESSQFVTMRRSCAGANSSRAVRAVARSDGGYDDAKTI